MARLPFLLFVLTWVAASNAHNPVRAAPVNPTPAGTTSANPPDGGARDGRSDGRPDCRFERPRVWNAGSITWLGDCRGGFADGSGVLVHVIEGGQPARFYGRLRQGQINVGVLQSGEGYVAGNWVDGAVAEQLADDMAQRNAIIAAFQAAASASTSVSKSLAKKGETRSSRFYAKQARLLRDQMD